MKNIISLFVLMLMLYSCGYDVEKFSQTFWQPNICFDKEGGDTTIVSQSANWRFDDSFKIDDTTLFLPRCEEVFPNSEPPVTKPGTCVNDDFTVKYDILREYLEPVQVEGSWFKLTKVTLLEANIAVSPNVSGKVRKFRVLVSKDGIEIVVTQLAE
jgi:hypothetical protein